MIALLRVSRAMRGRCALLLRLVVAESEADPGQIDADAVGIEQRRGCWFAPAAPLERADEELGVELEHVGGQVVGVGVVPERIEGE